MFLANLTINKDIISKMKFWRESIAKYFEDFLMFYQTFLSPQVKRFTIITYKHGIYELHHELPNNLRLKTLEN